MPRDLYAEAGIVPQQQRSSPRDLYAEAGITPKTKPYQTNNQAEGLRQAVAELGPVGAALARGGMSVMDAINGLRGLVGAGQDDSKVQERKIASDALQEAHPVASTVGNIAANAGMMYLGGAGLKGAGALANGANAARTAEALQTAGTALQMPTSAKQAISAGAAWGGATDQGDIVDRAKAAFFGGGGGVFGYGAGKAIGAGVNALRGAAGRATGTEAEALAAAQAALGNTPINSLPQQAQDAVKQMAAQAMAAGKPLDAAAAQRMADFKQLGIEPLSGWVSREPADYLAAHSMQGVDAAVTKRWADANNVLASKLQGSAPELSDYAAGSALRDVVQGKDAALKSTADQLYQQFRGMGGTDVPLNAARFNNNVAAELEKQMIGGKLAQNNPDVVKWFGKIQDGTEPFTFGTAAQRLQALNEAIYGSKDAAERKALGIVKTHLLNELGNAEAPASQQALADAFGQARSAAAQRFKYQDSSPLVDSITSGKFTPEKLPDAMKSLRVDDLRNMAQADATFGTDSLSKLRDAASIYIRDAAVGQVETGGKFSVAGLRKALDAIGPENGKMLFGDQWGQYQAMLRAGGAIMNQPAGIVANNSGTGQYIANMVKRLPIPGLPTGVNLAVNLGERAAQSNAAAQQLSGQIYRPKGLLSQVAEELAQPGGLGGLLGYYGGASAH